MRPEDLRPFIAGAADTVGIRRTDLDDVARILARGAYSAEAENRVRDHLDAELDPVDYDREAIRAVDQQIADLEARGYSERELLRRRPHLAVAELRTLTTSERLSRWIDDPASIPDRPLAARSNWDDLADLVLERERLYADLTRRSEALDLAVERWYTDHAEALFAIARVEAERLLADPARIRRQQLRALEDRLGLSKPKTAALCGVGESAVAHWRSGRRGVPDSALLLLAGEVERRERLAPSEGTRP